MKTRPRRSSYLLVTASMVFGIISIAPLLVIVLDVIITRIFSFDFQWLTGFLGWLGSTKLVVYLGWFSLPGLIVGIIAFMKGGSKAEKGLAVIGILLGLFGILWTYFIWGMLRIAPYL